MEAMSQQTYPLHELAPEGIECLLWLREQLLTWFEREKRSFPWREPGVSPYEVLVAEMLLQRTAAAGVARAYDEFFDHYPSWAALSNSPIRTSSRLSNHSGSGGRRHRHSAA
jgi:adenine-specific DNA glycosylase